MDGDILIAQLAPGWPDLLGTNKGFGFILNVGFHAELHQHANPHGSSLISAIRNYRYEEDDDECC